MGRTKFFLVVVCLLLVTLSYSLPASAADKKIIINKATNQLAYFEGEQLVKIFPVGTGKTNDLTPEGEFKIVAKLVNPYYRVKNIPGGDPGNPLGVRWLGLNARGTKGDTYGIHGNSNPASIGKYVSLGCIRMYNEDVIWLYDSVPTGTPVSIINTRWNLAATNAPAAPRLGIRALVDEEPIGGESFLQGGIAYTPLRELATALGTGVTWNPKMRAASLEGEKPLIVNVDGSILLQGREIEGIRAEFINDTFFAPVRFVAETLGADVLWDQENLTVSVISKIE